MSLASPLDALPEVRATVTADLAGRLLGPVAGAPALVDRHATSTAVAIAQLGSAGAAVGLHGLALLHVRGGRAATVTAVRPEGFLIVAVDPVRSTAPIEKALSGWTVPARSPDAPAGPPTALSASSLLSSSTPGAGNVAEAVFAGSLSVFALPDLLEFLRNARRTGLLVCSGEGGIGWLRLQEGFITAGAVPATPRLGELLLRSRKVSALALRALALPREGDDADLRAAEILVREGLVDRGTAREALQQQVALAVRELVGWKEGQFAFTRETSEPAASDLAVHVDPQAVLLQIFKELDEASRPDESTTSSARQAVNR